jgi:TctA family transporter
LDILNGLLYGFSIAAQPGHLALVFAGCLLGRWSACCRVSDRGGDFHPPALTFQLPPAGAIIMLAGIY